MTKTEDDGDSGHEPRQQQRTLRKTNVWTRDKITRLISLYRQHECLWNNYIEAYKNKERRKQAIEEICTTLRVTKFDFGKKIHNLRNQFNAEMKKLERRIEESGADGSQLEVGGQFRSRWDHYDSLIFLKDVISPRPGYQSNASSYQQHTRKIELKYQQASDDDSDAHVIITSDNVDVDDVVGGNATALDTTSEAVEEEQTTEYHYEEAALNEEQVEMIEHENIADDFGKLEAVSTTRADDILDQKYNPPSTMREVIITALPTTQGSSGGTQANKSAAYFTTVHHGGNMQTRQDTRSSIQHKQQHQHHQQQHQPQLQKLTLNQLHNHADTSSAAEEAPTHLSNGSILDFSAAAESCAQPTPAKRPRSMLEASGGSNATISMMERDQWDTFGEMVSAEFRNLNSDLSRKKLKRKIMQAMLEVGEEDDGININIAIN